MNEADSLPVAILAGGLATRLRPITNRIPKALVEVAGRPFLQHQIELLRANGITRIVLCAGHLGEMIRDAFGDGSSHGVRIEYSFDGDKLRGTGGALRKALPLLGEQFFVLYGDSYLPIDFREVGAAFRASGKEGLMTVFKNDGRWDRSNVWFENNRIVLYDKKTQRPEMRYIDYGLSVLSASVIARLPEDEVTDLADVLRELVARGELAGHEVHKRFYEIGSHEGLAELERLLASKSG
jgi:NDP-sugar pyrophosphorylase family protein